MHLNPNNNRGFLYGDGFFETMRVVNYDIPLWELHMSRAKRTSEYFEMDWFSDAEIQALKIELIYGSTTDAPIIRLDFYRDGAGTYVPNSNNIKISYTYRIAPYFNSYFALNQPEFEHALKTLNPISASIFNGSLKPCTSMSNLKSSSALWYVKAGLHLRKLNGIEDLILLNEHNRVCEGLTSNVLVQTNKKWYGVERQEGPVAGVYQQFLSDFLDIHFGTITTQQLRNADKILLTNAALGIRLVELVS